MEKIEEKRLDTETFQVTSPKTVLATKFDANLFMVQWQKEAARKEQKNKKRLKLDTSLQSVGQEG